MTLYLNRDAFETRGESFSGLPATILEGDVAPDATITFTADVKESGLADLRDALSDLNGFHGELQFRANGTEAYGFKFRFGHLVTPLPDRDWSTNQCKVVFAVQRANITDMVRPRGRPAHDPSEGWFQSLYVLGQDRDLWSRRRVQIAGQYAELDAKRAEVETAEQGIEIRKEALFANAEPEWVHQAHARGWS